MTTDPELSADADAMATAVGKFIMNFNILDERLNQILGVLLNSDDVARGEIVGAALMFTNKRQLIKALVHHVSGVEAAREYEPLDRRLKEINTVRNELAHGEQWYDFDGFLRQRRTRVTDKGYQAKHTSHSPDDVIKWATQVEDLAEHLWGFVVDSLRKK